MLDISIVIVNRNTRDLLLDCLGSVYLTVPPRSFEIWLVDNASSDGSVEAVRNFFPEVKCIENKSNLGFAKANNLAVKKSLGRYVALLNTDTVLTPSALENIISFMDDHKDVDVCGGQLLNGDGSLQNSIANIPTLATELLNKSLLRRFFPSRYPGKESGFAEPMEVESVIGACMVVAKTAVDGVGLMDEAYFFFLEETDWCLSMKKRGWRIFFHPSAKIFHLQGQTAKKDLIAARIEYWRSRYIFFRKHYSLIVNALLRVGLYIKLFLSLLMQCLTATVSGRARNRLKVNASLIYWHLLGCPTSWGLEKKADGS